METSIYREIIPLSEVPRTEKPGKEHGQVVLVVDDEPLVAETMALILSGAGFAAVAVKNGREALTVAQNVRPAFLLTDVQMPGMSGVQLALTFTTEFPECKILLFSGRATAKDLMPAVRAGIEFPMLAKPIHPTEIIKYISRSLRHAVRRPEAARPELEARAVFAQEL
jgi:FixJ family two-component response regulator